MDLYTKREAGTNVSSEIITIETQDSYGNSVPVNGDKTVSLFSNASSGSFAISPSGPWNINSIIIPNGESQASFYYKDEKPGIKTLGISENPSLGWKDATTQITINPNPVKKISFLSEEQSILANHPSLPITIGLLDENNQPTFLKEDISILLSSDFQGGLFALNSNGPWDLSLITIPANSSYIKFYYKNANVGTYTLFAKSLDGDIEEAKQNISVKLSPISKLSFVSDIQTISSSEVSKKIVVEVQDEQGNPRIVDSDTVIEFKSTSTSGQFSLDGINFGISSTIIKKGLSKIEFYYKDEGEGIFSLTVSEVPEKGWKNAVQQISVGEFDNKITKLSFVKNELNIKAGNPSEPIKIETVSIINRLINVDSDVDLFVTSDSPTGEFSKTINGPWEKNIILTILNETNSTEFYYKDSSAGKFNLFAKEYPEKGWDDTFAKVNVEAGDSAKIVFITPKQSILKNRTSSSLTIQVQDSYGNIKAMDENILINLLSSSNTGKFSISALNFEEINNIEILAGSSSVSFYYKDSTLGSFEIKAEKEGFGQGLQTIVISEDALDSIVLLPELGASQVNSNFQFTAIAYNAFNAIIPDVKFNWELLDSKIGTIDENGLFKAGSISGDFKDVIKVSANGREALASIKIFNSTIAQTQPSTSGGVIVIHQEVPLNASVVINEGDKETISQDVKLTLYATGATHMKVSNYPDFSDTGNWLPYTNSLNWKIKGEMNKNNIVYVKFKNLTGGESAVANDSIKFVEELKNQDVEKKPTQIIYNYYIVQPTNISSSTNLTSVPHIVSPTSGALILDTSIYLTGYAEPNSLITLSIHSDNQIIAKVISDNSGKFIYKIEPNLLEPGKHTVFATIEKDGESLVGPTTHFEIFSEDKNNTTSNSNEGIVLITNIEDVKSNKLSLNINILNFEGNSGNLIFSIKNSNGILVTSYEDSFKTKNQNIEFTKLIKTSEKLMPGKYTFETKLKDEDERIISNINSFEVEQEISQESIYEPFIFFIILFWLILIGIIIWGVKKIIHLKK